MTHKRILFATVGGSHQPILTTLRRRAPDYTVFVCSGDDPATGAKGSRRQIEGKGNVISSERGAKPDLPNIPAQAGLEEGAFEVLEVRADDLDDVYEKTSSRMERLLAEYPGAALEADYTGGTKSMSAGLVAAAIDRGAALLAVTGARDNLVGVVDGTEDVAGVNVERLRFERTLTAVTSAWKRFAYDEADGFLEAAPAPYNDDLRGRLRLAQGLSQAFAAWDRFDHDLALKRLTTYRARVGKDLGLHIKTLETIKGGKKDAAEALRINDLWLNALRRAAQGRYDDAVARLYRMLEWTAQWQLRCHRGIDTADIRPDQAPPGFDLPANRDGKRQAGLFQAWKLVERLLDNSASKFAGDQTGTMLDHLQRRNGSILAHGFTPVASSDWETMHGWVEQAFRPMFLEVCRTDASIRYDLDRLQLPAAIPE